MNNLIQWPRAQYWDKPWNPWLGCRHISPACDNCYARTSSERWGVSFSPHKTGKLNPPKSGVVFCGNMTDLFGEFLSDNDIRDWYNLLIEAAMGAKTDARYLVLTKRARRMNELRKKFFMEKDLESVINDVLWGITAENQDMFDERISSFAGAFNRSWLSCEPLLGPIDLHLDHYADHNWKPSWIAVGCESGAKRRPCKIEWIEDIVCQAKAYDIPVFVKQLDIDGECVKEISRFPKHLQIRQVPWRTR